MRLIDADEARKNLDVYLKKIHNHSINVVSKYGKEMFEITENAIRGCIDIVNLIPTVNRWIPCSERLPKKKGYYLVTRKNPKGHVTRVSYDHSKVERGVYNSPWGNGDADVLAWMELPKAYEVKE